ncbi:uncharacterized protein LOC110460813 [Mizuhopecten yessoensis]|uniref:uncharacterized protein LOC110460813 n=1 Tax=Mizuhopecten yessoensis TaxID=6573 RepID=UPI000B45D272|nr:uncharacterized protein LOC110460813 [Mizuhopecten yessoensis]
MDDHHSKATPGVPKSWPIYRGWAVNAWNKWTKTANQGRQLGESPIPTVDNLRLVSPKELDVYLKDFVNNVRRDDGARFKINSAYNIYRGLAAHLVINLKCPHLNFLDHDNDSFVEFRKAAYKTTKIFRKRKQMKDHTDQLDHEKCLWNKRFLDMDCPKSLLRAVYAFNYSVFGIETIEAHHLMLANQYVLGEDKDGNFVVFYGNLQESEHLSEVNNPIVSVEEIKLYDTGEYDSVYNIFKKYLNGIPRHGKFYILPCLSNCTGGTKRKMTGFSTTPMNYSQIYELHEDLITSQTYRKLFLLKDFDAQKGRLVVHPSQMFNLTHTSPTSVDPKADFFTQAYNNIPLTQGMENCAESLLNEENEVVVILDTSDEVIRETPSQKSPSQGQVQQALWAGVSNYDPASCSSFGNMMPGTPNMMMDKPNFVTGTQNLMTSTPNLMRGTTDVGIQTPNHHCIPAMRPLNIYISPETSQFENKLPQDRQTLLLRPNVDRSQDVSLGDGRRLLSPAPYQTEQIVLECADETSASLPSQRSSIQQHETAIIAERHRDISSVLSCLDQPRMERMYPNTNDITPIYTGTTHLRSRTLQCHSRSAEENKLNRTPSDSEKPSYYKTFRTAPPQMQMNLPPPPTAQPLNTTEYQHTPPLYLMDNATSVHPMHQLRSNAGKFHHSTPERLYPYQHSRQTRPMTSLPNQNRDQFPSLRTKLSRTALTNHCPPLNSKNQPISPEGVSPLSRMKAIKEYHKQLLIRQGMCGISPSSFLLQQHMAMQPRESQSVNHNQEQQRSRKKHFSEHDSQEIPNIEKLMRQSNTKRRNPENTGTPDSMEKGIQGQIDDGKGATFSAQSIAVPPQTLQAIDPSPFSPAARITDQDRPPSNIIQSHQDCQGNPPDLVNNRNGNDYQSSTGKKRLTGEDTAEPAKDKVEINHTGRHLGVRTGQNQTEANLLEDEREITIIDSAEGKIPWEVKVSPSIIDKGNQDTQLKQTNHSARNSNPDSKTLDQDIRELLDFDPSLRKSFHKKCADWWIRHKSNFEMNNLSQCKSNLNSQNMSTNSNKNDGKSENTVPENQQEISNQNNDKVLQGNATTGDMAECEKRRTPLSPSGADVCSNSKQSSPKLGDFNYKCLNMNTCSASVLNNDLSEQHSAGSHETKPWDGVGGHCVADDVKCMSAFYVD